MPAAARVKSRGRATKRREDGGSGGANGPGEREQSRKPIDPDANPVDVDADVDADVFGMVAAVRSCARYLGVGDAHARGIGPAAAGAAVATAGVVAFAMAPPPPPPPPPRRRRGGRGGGDEATARRGRVAFGVGRLERGVDERGLGVRRASERATGASMLSSTSNGGCFL